MDDLKLSQQTADKINPCPFCGAKADDLGGHACYITCKKCIVGNTVFIEDWNNATPLVSEDACNCPFCAKVVIDAADPEYTMKIETDNEIALRKWNEFYKETLKPGVWYGAYVLFPKWLTQQKVER